MGMPCFRQGIQLVRRLESEAQRQRHVKYGPGAAHGFRDALRQVHLSSRGPQHGNHVNEAGGMGLVFPHSFHGGVGSHQRDERQSVGVKGIPEDAGFFQRHVWNDEATDSGFRRIQGKPFQPVLVKGAHIPHQRQFGEKAALAGFQTVQNPFQAYAAGQRVP